MTSTRAPSASTGIGMQPIAGRAEGVDGADVGRVLHHDRAPGPPSCEPMRWRACWAPLVTRIWSGSVGTPRRVEVGGDLHAQGRQAERVVAACREERREVLADRRASMASATIDPAGRAPIVSSMASSTSGRRAGRPAAAADGRVAAGTRTRRPVSSSVARYGCVRPGRRAATRVPLPWRLRARPARRRRS